MQVLGDGVLAATIRECIPKGPDDFTWVAYDLESVNDEADLLDVVEDDLAGRSGTVILSTPFQVGTCAAFETGYPDLIFHVVPENIRVATALQDFRTQARIVIGYRGILDARVTDLLHPFTRRFIHMSPESAEMVKHALNGFLALSITYANEIAELATAHGADPRDVAQGLMSDPRIGWQAYLKPGPGVSPHLLREVHHLWDIGGGSLINTLEELCE